MLVGTIYLNRGRNMHCIPSALVERNYTTLLASFKLALAAADPEAVLQPLFRQTFRPTQRTKKEEKRKLRVDRTLLFASIALKLNNGDFAEFQIRTFTLRLQPADIG